MNTEASFNYFIRRLIADIPAQLNSFSVLSSVWSCNDLRNLKWRNQHNTHMKYTKCLINSNYVCVCLYECVERFNGEKQNVDKTNFGMKD